MRVANNFPSLYAFVAVAESRKPVEPLPTKTPQQRKVIYDRIQKEVCRIFDIEKHELLGWGKTEQHLCPRKVCLWVSVELCGYRPSELGRVMGKDHSSIIIAYRVVNGHFDARDETFLHYYNRFVREMDHEQLPATNFKPII